MDIKKFEEEMKGLLLKHGLKADGVELSEVVQPGAVETVKAGEDAKVVADLASKVAEKLAGLISEKKGLTVADRGDLGNHIKTKIFTSWGGLKEIEYPSDLKSLTKEEKIVNFMKALVYSNADEGSRQVLRALTEGTDAEGGYLVPEELRTEVFRVLPDITV